MAKEESENRRDLRDRFNQQTHKIFANISAVLAKSAEVGTSCYKLFSQAFQGFNLENPVKEYESMRYLAQLEEALCADLESLRDRIDSLIVALNSQQFRCLLRHDTDKVRKLVMQLAQNRFGLSGLGVHISVHSEDRCEVTIYRSRGRDNENLLKCFGVNDHEAFVRLALELLGSLVSATSTREWSGDSSTEAP